MSSHLWDGVRLSPNVPRFVKRAHCALNKGSSSLPDRKALNSILSGMISEETMPWCPILGLTLWKRNFPS